MTVFTKIEKGRRVLDVIDIDDFSIDDSISNILTEFNFKFIDKENSVRDSRVITTAIWELTSDFRLYVSYDDGSIEDIALKTKEDIHRFKRYKMIWFLNQHKEIGVDSDMVNYLMDTVRRYWIK